MYIDLSNPSWRRVPEAPGSWLRGYIHLLCIPNLRVPLTCFICGKHCTHRQVVDTIFLPAHALDPPPSSMKAVNCLSIVVVVLPLVTTPLIYLDIDFAFSPQGILYSHEIFPLLLAPFAPARNATEMVSRVIQSALLSQIPPSTLPFLYAFHIALATFRTLVGFVLTRSVGWAFPSLFSHWALYESMAGFGPLIVAYMTVEPISSYALPQIMAGLCWLEGRPWTYGLSLVLASVVRLVHHLYRQPTLPSLSNKTRSTSPWTVMLSLCAVLPYTLLPSSRLPFPDGASLDIVVLSYPRPVDVELSAYMLNTTILSYLPYVSPSVTLSVFTHAPQHQAFELVRQDHPSLVFT